MVTLGFRVNFFVVFLSSSSREKKGDFSTLLQQVHCFSHIFITLYMSMGKQKIQKPRDNRFYEQKLVINGDFFSTVYKKISLIRECYTFFVSFICVVNPNI